MEWRDEAIVLGVRRHGEASVILELMTADHGRHMGMVRGGRSRSMQPVLQAGNSVVAVWRARIEEHLGTYVIEPVEQRTSRIMASQAALHGINHIGQLLRLLPEREAHRGIYETILLIAGHIDEPRIAPALMVRFELALLQELGFGLDLSQCAASGATQDLIYVSPRTGRAVSRSAGELWAHRLLTLPAFLREGGALSGPDLADIAAGFRLTGYFLERDLFAPRGQVLPEGRRAYAALALSENA